MCAQCSSYLFLLTKKVRELRNRKKKWRWVKTTIGTVGTWVRGTGGTWAVKVVMVVQPQFYLFVVPFVSRPFIHTGGEERGRCNAAQFAGPLKIGQFKTQQTMPEVQSCTSPWMWKEREREDQSIRQYYAGEQC